MSHNEEDCINCGTGIGGGDRPSDATVRVKCPAPNCDDGIDLSGTASATANGDCATCFGAAHVYVPRSAEAPKRTVDLDTFVDRFVIPHFVGKCDGITKNDCIETIREDLRRFFYAEDRRESDQAKPEATHNVEVRCMSGNGEGPWRVLVNGFGIATWPAADGYGEAYAHEVARVLRRALAKEGT